MPKAATPAPDRADNPIHRPGLLSSPVFGVVISSSGIFSFVNSGLYDLTVLLDLKGVFRLINLIAFRRIILLIGVFSIPQGKDGDPRSYLSRLWQRYFHPRP